MSSSEFTHTENSINADLYRINTNVSKVCFWALAFIVHDQELLKKIRDEIAPAFTSESADLHHITHSCHLLNAVWLETLRLASISSSIRYITEDTMIGGKALRKGHRVMISARRLHFDEAVFGEDINVFRPSRFMKNPELRRHPGFRPFGGGVTLCPGRHLAKHTVLTFIALAVHRFDVTLDFPQSFPRFEEKKPIVGIMFGEDDLTLRLSRRVDPDGSGDGR